MKIFSWSQSTSAFAAIAFLLLGLSFRSEAAPLAFADPVSYSVTNASAIAAGDVNNDGKIDLLVAASVKLEPYPGNVPGPGLKIFTNGGSGTFVLATNYSIASAYKPPQAICVGKFDQDTNLDVVTMSSRDQLLTFFHGNGDGTFSASNTEFHIEVGDAVVGDFNMDGKLDILVSSNQVSILFGNGDGTFSVQSIVPQGPSWRFDAAAGDFNSDGKPDLVIRTDSDTVMMGIGNGSFTNGSDYSRSGSSDYYAGVATGDLNGDSKFDFVGCGSWSDTLSVRLNNGDGTFGTNTIYNLPNGERFWWNPSVTVADFNLDGKMDVMVNGTILIIFPGNGDGTFGSPYTNFPSIYFPVSGVAPGDFDGDSRLDFAYLKGVTDSVTVVRNITPVATISSVGRSSNAISFNVSTMSSHNYAVESSTNIVMTNAWTTVTNISGGTNAYHFVDTIKTNFPRQYYRVRMVQ